MKIKHNGEPREECTVADLRLGDRALVRYYDDHDEWTEELWTAEAIRRRKYGRGYRYTVDWRADGYARTTEISYSPRHKLARVIS